MKGKKNCKASGGSVEPKVAAGNPNVIAEAKERKKGGAVKKMFGKPEGDLAKKRMDRPQRKSGGAVNSTKSPFSSARGTTSIKKG